MFDGDIICLTDQKEIIDGAYGGLPIMYENKSAPKSKIDESELYRADIKGFNTKVGFLTNISTTMYSMLPMFEKDSLEYKEIIRRLKQCRKEQGAIIDATKGLVIKPIPGHWTNWSRIDNDNMTQEELAIANFNNSILVDKRPQFMEYLYSSYSQKYKQHYYSYNVMSIANFLTEFDDLISGSELGDSEQTLIDNFYKYNPLIDTPCEMNRISSYIQEAVKDIRLDSRNDIDLTTAKFLKDPDFNPDKKKIDKLFKLYKTYKSEKRNFSKVKDVGGDYYKTIDQYHKFIRGEALKISQDIGELASLAVVIVYEVCPSDNKDFAWSIFGDGIIENIKKNSPKTCLIPFNDKNGNIEYLGKRYSRSEVVVSEEDYCDFL